MTELTAWLLERIAADEAAANDALTNRRGVMTGAEVLGVWPHSRYHMVIDLARVLARCDADRRIVELCIQYEGRPEDATDPGFNGGAAFVGTNVLRALASVYADAPGFREEWL